MVQYAGSYSGISENTGVDWFDDTDANIYNSVFAHVRYLTTSQAYRSVDNIRNMRLYNNYDVVSLSSYNHSRVDSMNNTTHRVTLNIIQSMIDTVASKITKNKPRPTFLTDAGDWEIQQRAKKLTKYCEGIFYGSKLYQEATRAFVDSCVFGTGAVKFYKDNNEVKCERVLIDELLTDDVESYYGMPRTLHQTKFIHKDIVKAMFPGNDDLINDATTFNPSNSIGGYNKNKSMVFIVESWHLPSGKNAKDGKHTITISNKTLFVEKYTKTYYPFIFFKWCERLTGFWGQGLAEQLTGIQLEMNKILKTIQISMHLVSVPKLLVESSSKIVTAHLDNKIGGIIKYAGTPPSYAALGSIPPELFTHLDRLYSRAYEIVGVSSLSAQAKKPNGLDSGKALREFNDIESERFMTVGIRYEQAFIEASTIILGLAKDIHTETGEFKVRVKGAKFVETIDWADVDMEEDKYLMEVFPTSALSSTPAARLQDVTELIQAGFISKEDGLKLLDFPDLRSTTNLYNAGLEDIEMTIDRMMSKGEYQPPESYQNLELGIKKTQQAYLLYKTQNAPEERLELLRRWVEDATSLVLKANPAPAPEAAAAPLAAPEAPPSSDIVPLSTATPPVEGI